jgi:hypothetical protein
VGGTVTASSSHGAAIGGGCAHGGYAYVGSLVTEGGVVKASTAVAGAALGAGCGTDGSTSTLLSAQLIGGSFSLTSPDPGVSVSSGLDIGGGALSIDCASASSACIAAPTVTTRGQLFINVTTNTTTFRRPSDSANFNAGTFYGQYARSDSQTEQLTNGQWRFPYVHFRHLVNLPSGNLNLDFYCADQKYHLPVIFDSVRHRGLVLRLQHAGTYRVAVTGVRQTGYLCGSEGKQVTVGSGETFLENIDFCAGVIDDDSGGLSSGAKAAIAIGALILGGIIIGFVAYRVRAAVQPKFDKDGMDEYVLDSESATSYHPSQA